MKLQVKEITETITEAVKEVSEEIIDWVKEHKKLVILAAIGYLIWKWFIKEEENY